MLYIVAQHVITLFMDIRSLSAFIVLADNLHYRKASQICHMTTPTLSRMILRLEEEIGAQLFERTKREVALTDSGIKFYNFAKQTLDNYSCLEAEIHNADPKKISGKVMLYATVTDAYNLLPNIFKQFKNTYPNITICLETGLQKPGLKMLKEGEMDFTIGIENKRNKDNFDSITILETPLVFIVAKESKQTDLNTCPIIISRAGDLAEIVQSYFSKINITPNIHTYVEGHEAILAMVAAGLGGAILPEIVIKNSHLKDTVKIVTLKNKLPDLKIALFTKRNVMNSPVKRAFWNFIQAYK